MPSIAKWEFYEIFLQIYDDLDYEQRRLIESLKRGRNYKVIAAQLAELEVRKWQTDQIYNRLLHWL
jgi:hypothetical protein